jgi:glycosyltransferase involved in cell wall biosynthesis
MTELRKRYAGRTLIIYQGSMSEERGLFQMIAAMARLKRPRPDILLLLLGEMTGRLRDRALRRIQKEGLEEQVALLGSVPHTDMVNYISISKIGLVPFLPTAKYRKNIPTKQFEYMACGVPVLGADLPPITSYLGRAGSGKVYDSTDAGALAAGVLDMLDDEAGWERMSAAGKKAVQDFWNWDFMEIRLLKVYEDLLKE